MLNKRERKTALNGLKRAADLIRKDGWVQNRMSEKDIFTGKVIGYCLLGALDKVNASRSAVLALATYLDGRPVTDIGYIVGYVAEDKIILFNDKRGRTRGEVLRAIRNTRNKLLTGK